jgi:hypothetical protein
MNTLTTMNQPNLPTPLVLERFESQHWTVPILRPRPDVKAGPRRELSRTSLTPPPSPRLVALEIRNQP